MRKRLYTLTTIALILAIFLSACNSTDSIICGNCSSSNPKGNQYCANCGTAFFQSETQTSSNETQVTTPSASAEPSTNTIPQNTGPAPTQPIPTQPALTQPAPTQPPVTDAHTHSYKSATCTAPKSCSCGATNGSALGHNWSDATCTTPKKCSRCGTTAGSTAGHSYTTKITEATCTTQGHTTYTCSACGDSYKDNYVDSKHNYQNYRCTTCGAVDKSNAYKYLTVWVKQNGKTYGSNTDCEYTSQGVTYTLEYSAQFNNLSIMRSNSTGGTFGFSSIRLNDFFYGTAFGDYRVFGYLSASSFTSNSALSYTEYIGPSNLQADMIELARASNCDLLDWLEWYLAENNIGITISDLGFKVY